MIKKLLLLLFLICLPLASARAEDILCPHDSEYKGSVSCRCAADYKGNAEKCKQDQICSSVSGEYKCYTKDGYKEAGGKLDGGKCLPIKKLNSYEISKGGSCTLCVIIKVVFNTVSKVAAKADSAFSASTIAAVIAGFAVWLAVYALGYLASVETRDAKDILQELLSMGAVVTLVVIILQNGSSNFYSAFINPVYETGLAGAQAALKSANYTATGNMTVSQISGGLPASMGNSILSTMTAMESSVSKIRAFGSSMICYSWEKKVLLFIPRFSYLITGLFYWVMAMAIIIIVPLLMVDFVFELGAALALLPPAIGCYPFRATREFSKKVWETFLNSSFGFLFTSLVLIIIVKALEKCVEVSFKKSGVSFDSLFTDSSGDMETFLTGFHWTGEVTVRMVFGFILAWACMNLGKQFAKEFAGSISSPGGKSGGLGSSVGTMFASAGKSTLAKVTAPTRHAASKWMGKTSRAIAQRATQSAANARDRRRTRRQQKRFDNAEQNGNLIRNADGTTSIRRKRMFGLLGDKVTTRKADGSFVVSREKAGWQKALSETRRNVLKSSENAIEILSQSTDVTTEETEFYITTRKEKVTVYSQHGSTHTKRKMVSKKIRAKRTMARTVMRADGTMDDEKIAMMMEGLTKEQKLLLKKQIAEQILKQTFQNRANGKGKMEDVTTDIGSDGVVRMRYVTSGGQTVFTEMKIFRSEEDYRREAELIGAASDQAEADIIAVEMKKRHGADYTVANIGYEKEIENIKQLNAGRIKEARLEAENNQRKLNSMRPEISRMIISKKGRVTKLSTDGMVQRMDRFRLFNRMESSGADIGLFDINGHTYTSHDVWSVRITQGLGQGIKTGIHRVHRDVNWKMALRENAERAKTIASFTSMEDVEQYASEAYGGQIRSKTTYNTGEHYGAEPSRLIEGEGALDRKRRFNDSKRYAGQFDRMGKFFK